MRTLVLLHLAVTLVHGAAHAGAGVSLSPAVFLFVLFIIELGPLAGLAYMRVRPRAGAAIVAATMTGSLLFGFVNHFLIAGADHVNHVGTSWGPVFGITALLLLLTEAAGVVAGLHRAMNPVRRAS